jgi:hypothetical protein
MDQKREIPAERYLNWEVAQAISQTGERPAGLSGK